MISTDALIRDLSADCVPVQRRSIRREAVALLALGGLELAAILLFAGMRPDMGRMIFSPAMVWKIGIHLTQLRDDLLRRKSLTSHAILHSRYPRRLSSEMDRIFQGRPGRALRADNRWDDYIRKHIGRQAAG